MITVYEIEGKNFCFHWRFWGLNFYYSMLSVWFILYKPLFNYGLLITEQWIVIIKLNCLLLNINCDVQTIAFGFRLSNKTKVILICNRAICDPICDPMLNSRPSLLKYSLLFSYWKRRSNIVITFTLNHRMRWSKLAVKSNLLLNT